MKNFDELCEKALVMLITNGSVTCIELGCSEEELSKVIAELESKSIEIDETQESIQ